MLAYVNKFYTNINPYLNLPILMYPNPYRSQPSFCYQVRDVRYVSLSELQDMMNTPGLQWSPWFALIVRDLLTAWWKDLETTMTTDEHVNLTHIHRLF